MHFLHSSSFHSALPLSLLIGLASSAFAVTEPTTTITLREALLRTEQGNPELAAQRLRTRAVEARIEQADLRPNPTLGIELENFAGSGPLQGFDAVEATVQASQRIERGDKRTQRVALANAQAGVAQQTWSLHLTQLRHQTATAYIELLIAQRRVELTHQIVESAQAATEAIGDQADAGQTSTAALARTRAALIKARVAQNQAESEREKAKAALAFNWGTATMDFRPIESLPQTTALPDQTNLHQKMIQHARLDLQRAEISRRERELDVQRAAAKSDPTVGAGLRFLNEGSDAAFVAGISFPLPVRNQNQGNIRAAREDLAAAEQSTNGIRNELHHAFNLAWQDLTTAHRAVQMLRKEALPAITELHAITRQSYDQGQATWLEVVLAARERVALETEILAAEATYARALVQLDALTDPTFPLTSALLSSP